VAKPELAAQAEVQQPLVSNENSSAKIVGSSSTAVDQGETGQSNVVILLPKRTTRQGDSMGHGRYTFRH